MDPALDPAVLQAVLQGVQGFVAALAAARKQQQPQAATELRQRLAALGAAAAACSDSRQQQQQQQQGRRRHSAPSSLAWHSDDSDQDEDQELNQDELLTADNKDHTDADGDDTEVTVADHSAAADSDDDSIPSIDLVFCDTASASQAQSVTNFDFVFGTAAGAASSGDIPSSTSSWFADVGRAGPAGGAAHSSMSGSSLLSSYMAVDDGSTAGGAAAVTAHSEVRSEIHHEDGEFGMWGDTDSQEGAISEAAAEDSNAAGSSRRSCVDGVDRAAAAAAAAAAGAADGSIDSSSGRPHPYLSAVIDAPDVAELMGAANMRALLLQRQRAQLQQLQQFSQLQQEQFWFEVSREILAVPSGQPLPYTVCHSVLLLLDLSALSDAQVLQYWRAMVASAHTAWLAEIGGDSSSSSEEQWDSWEGGLLVELLVGHAGFDAAAAMQLVETCSELSTTLQSIEATYAAACGKEPFEAEYAIMKPDLAAAAAAGDGSSAVVAADKTRWLLIGSEALPQQGASHGLQFSVTFKQQVLSDADDSSSSSSRMDADGVLAAVAAEAVSAGGAAATHHLAVLLTRAALALHPWQQAGSCIAMAGAASVQVLQGRLLLQKSQLDLLQQRLQEIVQLMQPVQRRNQQQQQRRQRHILHQLLRSAMPAGDDEALEQCAENICDDVGMQLLLLSAVRDVLPAAASSSSSNAHGSPWALPAAALHFLFRNAAPNKLQQWQDVIAGPLAVHQAARSSFGAFVHLANQGTTSSSSSDLSSSHAGSRATATLQELMQQQPDRCKEFAPPGSLQPLLAAVETSLCQRFGQLLADSAALQESAAALAGKALAGAAACDSLLQQASRLAGPQELGQLLSEKAQETMDLKRDSEDLTVQRLQQDGEVWKMIAGRLDERCKFSMVAMLLWHMVDVQCVYEIESVADLHQQLAEQLSQKQQQLLEQWLEGQLAWPAYQVQLQALQQAEVERKDSILRMLEWQLQQHDELQPVQEALRRAQEVLSRLIGEFPHAMQATQQLHEHAKAAGAERVDGWQQKFKQNSRRTFRPAFSSSSSSSSDQEATVALLSLMSLEKARSGALHWESLYEQQHMLLKAVGCIATAGLGMLHAMGLRLPGAAALAAAAGTSAAADASYETAAQAAAAAAAAADEFHHAAAAADNLADVTAENKAESSDGQQSSSTAGLQRLLVWQALQLDGDNVQQLSVLLQCIGGNPPGSASSSSKSSASRRGRRSRVRGRVGSSAARSSTAPEGTAAGASGSSRRSQGISCSIAAARGRLAEVLLAESEAMQAADAAAEAGPSSSSSSSSKVAAQQVLWQLLLAVRPAACAALHCLQQLPHPCVSFGAFARATLDWRSAMGGSLGFNGRKQPDGSSSSSSSSLECRYCERPGYIYVASVLDVIKGTTTAVSSGAHSNGSSSSIRSVCSSTICVSEELRELAQQGPPAALMQAEDWDQLSHSTAHDLKLTGRQDVGR
jgi:hypothetical protein